MSGLRTFVVLFLLVAFVNANYWKLCDDSGNGVKITDVEITGCTGPPCVFKKGENATVNVKFTSNNDYDHLYTSMCGIILGKCLNLPLADSDECDEGATCPIKKGSKQEITVIVHLDKSFPSVKVVADFSIQKDKNEDDPKKGEGCFAVEIQLK